MCYIEYAHCFVLLYTWKLRQNGFKFADNIHFLHWKLVVIWLHNKRIYIYELYEKITLKYVHKSPIANKPTLVQIIAWCQTGNKPISEPVMAYFGVTYIRYPQWVKSAETFGLLWFIYSYLSGLLHYRNLGSYIIVPVLVKQPCGIWVTWTSIWL